MYSTKIYSKSSKIRKKNKNAKNKRNNVQEAKEICEQETRTQRLEENV